MQTTHELKTETAVLSASAELKSYAKPELKRLGSVREVTLGINGSRVDANSTLTKTPIG